MRITKRFSFDAAHSLPNYEGDCKNLHGHRWLCKITVLGDYDEKSHMICDFKKLKKLIEENVVSKLDHTNLNDIFEVPTAEDIAVWIFEQLFDDLDKVDLLLYEIELWESPDSSVIFSPFFKLQQLEGEEDLDECE